MVRIWETSTGQLLKCLDGHTATVLTVAFGPDGNLILSGGKDGTVRTWDIVTGQARLILRGHRGWVSSAVFNLKGTQIVSGGYDGTLRIWDSRMGSSIRVLKGHRMPIISVGIVLRSGLIVCSSATGHCWLWDGEKAELVARSASTEPQQVCSHITTHWRATGLVKQTACGSGRSPMSLGRSKRTRVPTPDTPRQWDVVRRQERERSTHPRRVAERPSRARVRRPFPAVKRPAGRSVNVPRIKTRRCK